VPPTHARRPASAGDAAAQHTHARARAAHRVREPLHPRAELADPHIVVMADVRRRAHAGEPVSRSLPGHAEAVAQVDRPVVDAGQDVTVEIYQPAGLVSLPQP